jgi:hypothetical protein
MRGTAVAAGHVLRYEGLAKVHESIGATSENMYAFVPVPRQQRTGFRHRLRHQYIDVWQDHVKPLTFRSDPRV